MSTIVFFKDMDENKEGEVRIGYIHKYIKGSNCRKY